MEELEIFFFSLNTLGLVEPSTFYGKEGENLPSARLATFSEGIGKWFHPRSLASALLQSKCVEENFSETSAPWVISSPSSTYEGQEGVRGEGRSIRAGGRKCKETRHSEHVWQSIGHQEKQTYFRVPCACHRQNNCLVRIQIKTTCSPSPRLP